MKIFSVYVQYLGTYLVEAEDSLQAREKLTNYFQAAKEQRPAFNLDLALSSLGKAFITEAEIIR